MNYLDIPLRTARNPLLSIKETNALIQAVKNTLKSDTTKRSSSTPYGHSTPDFSAERLPINLKFLEDFDPFSIFSITYDTEDFEIGYANPTALLNPTLTTDVQTNQTVFCTNAEHPAFTGSRLDCWVVGTDKPHLLVYDGTDPAFGDFLIPVAGQKWVEKNASGPLIAVSQPDVGRKLIWALRYFKAGSGSGSATYFGKLTANVATGAAEDMTIWEDGVATASVVEVVNRTGQTLKTGVLMKATQGIGCTEYLVEPYELKAC